MTTGRIFHYKNSKNSTHTYCEYCGVIMQETQLKVSRFCPQCEKNFAEEDIEVELFEQLPLTKKEENKCKN